MSPTVLLLTAALVAAPGVSRAASPAASAGKGGVPAFDATRAEAEKTAKLHFHCTGAHKMSTQWMPCDHHARCGARGPAQRLPP